MNSDHLYSHRHFGESDTFQIDCQRLTANWEGWLVDELI